MGNSVLDGCGKFSGELTEISNIIKKTKLKNGEPFDIKINMEIEQDVYYAYSIILNKLIDRPELVGTAINNLKKKIEESPNLTSLFGMSENSAQITLENNRNIIETNPTEIVNTITEGLVEGIVINDIVYSKEELSESIEQIDNIMEELNIPENKKVVFEEPLKPEMEFKNETDEMIEEEICNIQTALNEIFEKAKENPAELEKSKDQITRLKEKSSNDLWIDAELRYFNYAMEARGSESVLSDEFQVKEFEKLIETLNPENVGKTQFADDQFTSWEKIGIMRGVLKEHEKNPTVTTRKMCENLKKMDSEIYEMIRQNPEKFKKIEGQSSDEFLFADGVKDRKTFLESISKRLEIEKTTEKVPQDKEDMER